MTILSQKVRSAATVVTCSARSVPGEAPPLKCKGRCSFAHADRVPIWRRIRSSRRAGDSHHGVSLRLDTKIINSDHRDRRSQWPGPDRSARCLRPRKLPVLFPQIAGPRVLDVVAAGILDCVESRLALLFRLIASSSGTDAPCPRSSRETVMSMSSENLDIRPKAFESDVPPLKRNRGCSAGRPLNKTSSVQVTQKSFSTFCSGVPRRAAAARKTSRRSC